MSDPAAFLHPTILTLKKASLTNSDLSLLHKYFSTNRVIVQKVAGFRI